MTVAVRILCLESNKRPSSNWLKCYKYLLVGVAPLSRDYKVAGLVRLGISPPLFTNVKPWTLRTLFRTQYFLNEENYSDPAFSMSWFVGEEATSSVCLSVLLSLFSPLPAVLTLALLFC